MRSVRPMVLMIACLGLAALLTSCGGHAEGARKAALTSIATPDTLALELKNSKAVIEQHIGKAVEAFAYPCGLYDSNILRQTQAAGYRAAVTVADGLFDTTANWLEMPRQNVSYSSDLDAFSSLLRGKAPQ